jgi:hypothetical protein
MLKKFINWLFAKNDFNYNSSVISQDFLKNKSSFEKELKTMATTKKKAPAKKTPAKKSPAKKTAPKKTVKKSTKKK